MVRRFLVLVAASSVFGALLVIGPAAGAVGNPPHDAPVNIGPDDFPDPFVLKVGDEWYAYGTDGDLGDVQVIKSTDLVNWSNVGTAIAKDDEPSWAQHDDVWAPGATKAGANYVLYNAYLNKNSNFRCIGAATSTNPGTGFKAAGTEPLLCNDTEGGVIDPDVFVGFGHTYLLWKTEGVPGAIAPALWSQQLTDDGLSLVGSPSRLLSSRYPYEGTLIENPTMVENSGRLYLFYSGNEWESPNYAVGWAVCEAVQGPCAAPPDKPLLTSAGNIVGPGGGTVFPDGEGQWWLGFAAWTDPSKTTEGTGSRKLFFRRMQFQNGRPVLQSTDGSYPAEPLAQRVAGTDRYDTSARFSAHTVQAFRPVTYVATGADFPDALASGPVSGFEGSPVLLVQRDRVPASVKAELCRVRPGHIVVMGGTGAISDAVYNEVTQCAINGSAHRESGVNRYHTASLVSRNTYDPGVSVAYVATGERFADALAGGAAGAHNKGPLLLVQQNAIPFDTGNELARLKPKRIVVLGGPSAVSDETVRQLGQYASNVSRVAGNDRYETAALVARQEFGSLTGGLVIATGVQYPDAVAAGAAGFPVLLVPSTGSAPASVKSALDALEPLGVLVMGGTGAVSEDTLRSLGL
jgi:putative cell wall-binding protein